MESGCTTVEFVSALDAVALRRALLSETDLLGEFFRAADPAQPVPTCPGWTLADLITHVGLGHRWVAALIADRAAEPYGIDQVPDAERPPTIDATVAWLRDSARLVLAAVDATGSDVPIWTPFGAARPAEWWVRRRLHEATGHRADALLSADRPVTIDANLAADGVTEFLALLAMGSTHFQTPLDTGTSLSLHATDTDTTWSVRRTADTIVWTDGQLPATTTVRGPAVEVYLLLLRRISVDHPRLEVDGDTAVLDTWLRRTAF
ncbi:maleylpyruvate isomerase family mycothiol-dependent enzyme [Nocardia terpenica]